VAELLPLALAAALYPPILAMVVVILARPSPRNLLLAYVLGALLVSIAVGLGIVAALNAGNAVGGSDRTVNPTVDIAAGLGAYFVAWILLTDRDRQLRERRARRRAEKADGRDPWSRRVLERDSVRLTFLLGVVLNLPGASYLVALKDIAAADQSTTTQVLEIVGFNLIMFVLAEIPLVSYTLRPERAADDAWQGAGSAMRVDMLNRMLRRTRENGKWSLASVTAAMNAAATQDVRAIDTVPLLKQLLKGTKAPNAQARQMLDLMIAWRRHGGNRLDLNDDGLIDDPGAAIMDAAWPKIADAFMRPQLGPQLDELDSLFPRWSGPPSGQERGWYQYFDRDIRRLLGKNQKQPFENRYCGGGNLQRCRSSIWEAIAAAGQELTSQQGTSDPSKWRADANAERIHFVPGLLPTTMRYTNRPSGIQQVISFNGHR
jgi:Sap, sulfolipid-1-addressing protein/Penicillin amidase